MYTPKGQQITAHHYHFARLSKDTVYMRPDFCNYADLCALDDYGRRMPKLKVIWNGTQIH